MEKRRLIYIRKSDNPILRFEADTVIDYHVFDAVLLKDNDMVLFEGGYVYPAFELTGLRGLMIGSYGTPAVIDGGCGHGVVLSSCENITLFGLKVKGIGWRESCKGIGVYICNCANIAVKNVEMCGFRNAGLSVFSSDDVLVEGCFSHDNGFCGICSHMWETYSSRLVIRHCKAFDNAGDPDVINNHSGSGIAIFSAKDVVVEYCETAGNGWAQRQCNINGPVGIWCACDCTNVVFRKNISHHNCTQPGGVDGDGFDIDGAVVNGLMEYNYSYENEGSGYLLCEYGSGMDWKNNNMRYCISINDALRVVKQGSVQFYGPDGLKMEGSRTENCLLVPSAGHHGIVNQEVGKDCTSLVAENNWIVEGGAAAVSHPENPYFVTGNNVILCNPKVYQRIIRHTPRLTNPRLLDNLPVFDYLIDGTMEEKLQAMEISELFGVMQAPLEILEQHQFTYYLNGKDFAGSSCSGDMKITYDHIRPGMALEMKKGADIRFPYPAWDSQSRHLAVLTARLQSPDVESILYVMQNESIVEAVPIAGGVSDYHTICLTFDGFEGIPSVGIRVLNGFGSLFLEEVRIYKMHDRFRQYSPYFNVWEDKTEAVRSVGNVYADGTKLILCGTGSAILQSVYLPLKEYQVQAEIEAASNGGWLYAVCGNKRVEQPILQGRHTYLMTFPETVAEQHIWQYGVWNGIVTDEDMLTIYQIEIQ